MLKIQFTPLPSSSEDSHNFTFTSPTSALTDRDRFKDDLSAVVARNREREAAVAAGGGHLPPPPTLAAAGAAAAEAAAASSRQGRARRAAADSPAPGGASPGTPNPSSSSSAAIAAAATNPSASASSSSTAASDFRLRKLVLQSSPALLSLHRDLVLSGALTESEFWQGREDLLASVAAEEGLMKGKSGEMVDPKTVTGQNGEVTVKITPGLIREIFEEWPVVLRAYNENVPEPVRLRLLPPSLVPVFSLSLPL